MAEDHRNSLEINLWWCLLIGVMCFSMVQAMSECGLVQNSDIANIRNGSEVLRYGWPFIAALYEKPNRFLCSGTIISTKHVLTTAQCVHLKNSSTKYDPTEILVRLGTTEIEEGMQIMNVSQIHVHEEPYGDRSNADIAVVVLSIDVTFNLHVQPVCLPADDVVNDDIEGHIIGWGNAENETTQEILTKSASRVLNDSNCYPNESSVGRNSSLGSFCAGHGSGGVPNSTDNGAGFFVLSQSHWVQFGIITSTQTNGNGHVSPQSAAAFTNVKLFTTWIEEILFMGEWEIVIDSCLIDDKDMYNCKLVIVPGTGYDSDHIEGKTNDDVDTISILNFVEIFPTGSKIGQMFRNLKRLEILDKSCDVRVPHTISRTNFENMENLIELNLDFGSCEFNVELDFLKILPNLEEIHSGYFTRIHCNETTFQANSRLKKVELHAEGFIPWNLFQNNLMLESIRLIVDITDIDERMFKAYVRLRDILLSGDELNSLPWNLFEANVELRSIDISGDELKSLPWNLFEANVELRDIHISGRELKSLPWNLFKSNLVLEQIWVRRTGITEIDERTFETNEKLRIVKMFNNELEVLPRDLFKHNLMLEEISFDENKLKIIEIDFTVFKNVGFIHLLGNPCVDSISGAINLDKFQRKINSSCIANSSSDHIQAGKVILD